jgi:excisionase family DNA binding protein
MAKLDKSAFLTVNEGHAVVGLEKISRRAFYNAMERGEIPNIRLGRRRLIPRKAFMTWLEGCGAVSMAA